MSSSEEYLDSLLKSLTEGTGDTSAEATEPVMEPEPQEDSSTMSDMDDIAAMFASMGEGAPAEEEPPEEEPSEGDMLADDLALAELLNGSGMSDDMPQEDGASGDGESFGDSEPALDELSLDDDIISDEQPDEDLSLNDLFPDDNLFADGTGSEEEPSEGELSEEDMLADDLALAELLNESGMSDDMPQEDGVSGDGESLEDNDLALDDLSLDDGILLDEQGGEPEGDLSLDDLFLDDSMPSDETGSGEEAPEEDMLADDPAIAELLKGSEAVDDLSLDGSGDDSASEDHFALEETGEEDAELSALLASMGGDENLSEISELLEKSDQGVAVDDDIMSLLDSTEEGNEGADAFDFFSGEEDESETLSHAEEGEPENIREITPEELEERENPKSARQKKKEEKERKKKEKLAKKKAAKSGASGSDDMDDSLAALVEGAEAAEGQPKKQGFWAKLMAALLEEDESGTESIDTDDLGLDIGNISDENKELLDELSAEDKKNAKKKEKKEKKAKKSKDKKGGKAPETEEGGEEGEAGEAEQKPKKEKKKKKKEKAVDEIPQVPEKKLSKKKVTSVFLFCATIAACVLVVTVLLPAQMEKQEARVAFDRDQYAQAYELLYGKKLSEEDEVLLQKSSVILQMQRKLDSYENYSKLDMPVEALNALLEGVSRYQKLSDKASQYNVSDEVLDIYGQILDALAYQYGLSEEDALDIIASGDDVTYSQRVQAAASGEAYAGGEETPQGKQDVLPEEEEIIDRLENTETE